MLTVSLEMDIVRGVSPKVVMMSRGQLVERGPPTQIFRGACCERSRSFFSRIMLY